MSETALIYKAFALAFRDPDEPLVKDLRRIEIFRRNLTGVSVDVLKREYVKLFALTVAGGVPPYETEYGHKEIFGKTQAMADIAGFYRAFGLEGTEGSHERVDFIATELEFMGWLAMKEERALETGRKEEETLCNDAAAKFMKDHLGRWAPFFCAQILKQTDHPFYRAVGENLRPFIESESRRLGVEPEQVTGWEVEPLSATEFQCGPDAGEQVPQPLTIIVRGNDSLEDSLLPPDNPRALAE